MRKNSGLSLLIFPGLIMVWMLLSLQIKYQEVMLSGTLILMMAAAYWLIKEEDRETQWLVIICAFGFLLKACYVLYTPVSIRQHDVHNFFKDDNGHSAYIRYILDNWHLPDFDPREVFQFYHPPLHHVLAAVWVKVNRTFGLGLEQSYRNIQILTLGYTAIAQVVMLRILETLRFRGKALFIPLMVFCFHPYMIFLAGSVNNDTLAILFTLLIILYSLKWNRDPSWKNIVILALCYGLGMSTKLSVGYLAPATALLFIWKMVSDRQWVKKYLPQWIVFAVIAFPLGLWWYVRNYLQFGVPIGYVPSISSNSKQYLGDRFNVLQRLFTPMKEQLEYLYICFGGNEITPDYNIPLTILKSSVFEEQTLTKYYSGVRYPSVALFIANLGLILTAIAGQIRGLKTLLKEENAFLILMYAVVVLSFLFFCFGYPAVCTMSYRYIVPTMICGVIGLAVLMETRVKGWVVVISAIFCLCSIGQFAVLGL